MVAAITGPAALRRHHIRTELTDLVDVLVPVSRQRRDAGFVRLYRTNRMPERIWETGPVRYVPPSRAVADAGYTAEPARVLPVTVTAAIAGHMRAVGPSTNPLTDDKAPVEWLTDQMIIKYVNAH